MRAAPGTPEPPESSTQPPVTRYTFEGEVTQRDVAAAPLEPGCVENGVVSFAADLSVLGITTGEFQICLTSTGDPFPLTGSGSLTAADGTLSALVSGTVRASGQVDILLEFHLDITITGGTGAFEGAVGTAVYDDRDEVVDSAVVFSGELSGTFDVPSS
jgi:hypothetical protein